MNRWSNFFECLYKIPQIKTNNRHIFQHKKLSFQNNNHIIQLFSHSSMFFHSKIIPINPIQKRKKKKKKKKHSFKSIKIFIINADLLHINITTTRPRFIYSAHTHTHTHIYIYMLRGVCIYMCACERVK